MERARRVVTSALLVVAVAAGFAIAPTGTAVAAASATPATTPVAPAAATSVPAKTAPSRPRSVSAAATPVTTTLTCQQNGQMVDDPTSGDVVVLCPTQVVVLDANANIVATIVGVAGTSVALLGADAYVLEPATSSMAQISLGATPAVVHTFALGVAVPGGAGNDVAAVGTKVWFETEGATDDLASLDPATGTVVVTTSSWSGIIGLAAVPGTSTLLVSTQLSGGQRVDVSTNPPTPVGPSGDGNTDVVVSSDGTQFWSGQPGGVGEDTVATMRSDGVAYPPDSAAALGGGVAYSPGSGGVLTSGGEVWLAHRPVEVTDDGDPGASPEGAALSADGTALFTVISIATPQNTPGWSRVHRYSLVPTITGVTGPAVAGVPATLTVTGTNLGGITSATLGGQAASISSNASPVGSTMAVDLPSGVAAGTRSLVLHSPLGDVTTTVAVLANTGATLSGSTAARSTGVAGIQLTLSGGGLGSPRTTTSANDGSYSFPGLPYGLSYRLATHDPSGTYPDQVVAPLTLIPPDDSNGVQVNLDDPLASSDELATVGLPATPSAVAVDPATGTVFVAAGDDVVAFDQDGDRLGQADDQWGAANLAFDGAGSVYVDDHSGGRISRIDTSTFAVTGSWATGLLGKSLAYVDGRVWFGTGQLGQAALAALDPSTGTISTYASPDEVAGFPTLLAAVVGGDPDTLLVAYENGVSSELIEYDVTSGSPVEHASATPIAPGPVAASSATGTVWDEAGFEYQLSNLASTGRSFPAGQPWQWSPTYSPGMGGLLAMGADVDRVSNQSDPIDLVGGPDLLSGEALNAAGTRAFTLSTGAGPVLEIWDLGPHLGAATPSLPPGSTSFTLSGTGLYSATGVTVDGTSRSFVMETSPEAQSDLSVTVPALAVGWHTVTATTPWGASYPLGFLVGTVPVAPGAPTAGAGDAQATVAWSAPADDGGFPVTGYLVTASPGVATCSTTTSLTCTVTGLTNYQPYRFTVQAENQLGASTPSPASNTVIPKPAGDWFHPLTPSRILDSRPSSRVGPYSSPWAAGQTRTVGVTGVGGVPADAAAVVLNVTVTDPTAPGYLTVWPAGSTQPVVSSLNWTAGETIPNSVTAPVGSGGVLDVYNAFGRTDVVVDVVGYYAASGGSGLVPLSSRRILDSRPSTQVGPYSSPWAPGQTRTVAVGSTGWVPSDATAVVLNVTVTDPTTAGYLTVWPGSVARPLASSLNWTPGETIPNAVTVPVGPGGVVDVYNASGRADVVIDVVGYFLEDGGQPFHPVAPTRILDTRLGQVPLGPDEAGEAQVAGLDGVPDQAAAVMANITVTDTTASSFLAVWPGDADYQGGSSLNWTAGETIANAVVVTDDGTDLAWVGNFAGNVDVIIDVSGWYG